MKNAGETLLLALSLLLLVSVSAAAQERATPYIYALHNPVVIAPDQTRGSVTLVWDGGRTIHTPKHGSGLIRMTRPSYSNKAKARVSIQRSY